MALPLGLAMATPGFAQEIIHDGNVIVEGSLCDYFVIQSGAPDHSIFIADNGSIGFGRSDMGLTSPL